MKNCCWIAFDLLKGVKNEKNCYFHHANSINNYFIR